MGRPRLCPQCESVRVFPAQGRWFRFGRCRACAVVVIKDRAGWRILTEAEWLRWPILAEIRPWAQMGYLDDLAKVLPPNCLP